MERRNSKKWINDLKIAIVNNNLKMIEKYSNRSIPQFSSIEEAKEALHLVNEAMGILQNKKNEIGIKLNSLKQQQTYTLSNTNPTFSFQA